MLYAKSKNKTHTTLFLRVYVVGMHGMFLFVVLYEFLITKLVLPLNQPYFQQPRQG